MPRVHTAAPLSLNIMACRRSQRSTSAPAMGEITMPGKAVNREISANCVTEPARWYTHTPSANPVRLDPRRETDCPNQMRRKAPKPWDRRVGSPQHPVHGGRSSRVECTEGEFYRPGGGVSTVEPPVTQPTVGPGMLMFYNIT